MQSQNIFSYRKTKGLIKIHQQCLFIYSQPSPLRIFAIIILTICNINSRRIDFSGHTDSSCANTRKKFDNHLHNNPLSKNDLSFQRDLFILIHIYRVKDPFSFEYDTHFFPIYHFILPLLSLNATVYVGQRHSLHRLILLIVSENDGFLKKIRS